MSRRNGDRVRTSWIVAALAIGGVVGAAGAGVRGAVAQGGAGGGATTGPLAGFDTHLVATHYLRDREYRTHHYFKTIGEGVLQGLVFRESGTGEPLIEVEWAIGREVYDRLPAWQQVYWHPLAPAVDAGRVSLPDLPPEEERSMLGTIRGLYAQTLNLAGLDGELPIGLEGIAMVTHLTAAEMRALMGMQPR